VSDRRVALTFDAEHPGRSLCPPGNAERVLDILAQAGVRATFFVQGRWATAYPAVARRIGDEGHLVGNHSNYHARMLFLTGPGIEEDVRAAEDRIEEATGNNPKPWFRCPFGAGAGDRRVLNTLRGLGYRNVGWNVAPKDWREDRTGQQVEDTTVEAVQSHGDGAIILLHTWPGPTAEALPGIVARIGQAGSDLVTVDEVLHGG
jgi:peptidoglycan-N-acetylglucosamine deacetylase